MEEVELQVLGEGATNDSASNDDLHTRKEDRKVPVMIFVSAFFMIVASVLGTGILGLPVTVASSGLPPFLLSYSICLLMQVVHLLL